MKSSWYVKILIPLLCAIVLMTLSSCQSTTHPINDSEMQPVASEENSKEDAKIVVENSEATKENAPDISDLSELQESQEPLAPQEDFRAQYIGKTVGDVVQDLGDEYVVDYYEGSTMIGYPDNLWFLFGSTEDTITDGLIIRQMIASGQYPAVYELTGSMTYPEIVETVGKEVELPQPNYRYIEADEDWSYALGFTLCEYCLSYTWLDDPEDTPSASVYVLKQDVELSKPNAPQINPDPPEESDHNNDLPADELTLFCGPGWFEGVVGSRFYVPDGFIQQDLIPAMGHYFLFKNDELNMSISVHELTFEMLGTNSTAMIDEYAFREADDSVTYATSGDNFYVVSGYYDPEGDATVYYNRVDYDEEFRYEVNFQYPASDAEEGEEILLGFLKDYSISCRLAQ